MRATGGGSTRADEVNNSERAVREGVESLAARQLMGALLCVTEWVENTPKSASPSWDPTPPSAPEHGIERHSQPFPEHLRSCDSNTSPGSPSQYLISLSVKKFL